MSGVLEWIIFLSLSLVAIVMAAGMLLTMSMYRAGLALMASFVALAGLFILLGADLLAAIQIMMNVGGMLVMVLFMVMIMMDPGGEMMWGMKRDMHIPGPAAFSMHMPWRKPPEAEPAKETVAPASEWTCPMHPEVSQPEAGSCPKCGMALIPRTEAAGTQTEPHTAAHMNHAAMNEHPNTDTMQMPGHDEHIMPAPEQTVQTSEHPMNMEGMNHAEHGMQMSHSGMTPRQYYDMMVDMAMSTAQLPWAIVLGVVSAILLIFLVVLTPWPLARVGPTQDATTAVGELLLSRYMIGFEGAAFLILAGIVGAVIFAIREREPVQTHAEHQQPVIAEEQGQEYTCPMHPEVRQSQPGICPKCSMSLIPVEKALPTGGENKAHGGQREHEEHEEHGGHT